MSSMSTPPSPSAVSTALLVMTLYGCNVYTLDLIPHETMRVVKLPPFLPVPYALVRHINDNTPQAQRGDISLLFLALLTNIGESWTALHSVFLPDLPKKITVSCGLRGSIYILSRNLKKNTLEIKHCTKNVVSGLSLSHLVNQQRLCFSVFFIFCRSVTKVQFLNRTQK